MTILPLMAPPRSWHSELARQLPVSPELVKHAELGKLTIWKRLEKRGNVNCAEIHVLFSPRCIILTKSVKLGDGYEYKQVVSWRQNYFCNLLFYTYLNSFSVLVWFAASNAPDTRKVSITLRRLLRGVILVIVIIIVIIIRECLCVSYLWITDHMLWDDTQPARRINCLLRGISLEIRSCHLLRKIYADVYVIKYLTGQML